MNERRDIQDLLAIMRRLRDPEGGCPWDLEQDFDTIAPYTIEEAYEVADAIARRDFTDLRDELGDLLFQVVFHAQMAAEGGRFDFGQVVRAVCEKMERRHPHVFGDATIADAEDQSRAWEEHKTREREGCSDSSALAGVAQGLPEWLRALKLQKRAAGVGFDWDRHSEVLDKLEEELFEIREATRLSAEALEEEFGDFLFAALNLSRHLGVDAGRALRAANRKFENRFRAMEAAVEAQGRQLRTLTPEQMDELWEEAKARERAGTPRRKSAPQKD